MRFIEHMNSILSEQPPQTFRRVRALALLSRIMNGSAMMIYQTRY
jgi:hypothetical protein